MYVAIVPMKILPLCTSNATFQSDIGSWFMLEGCKGDKTKRIKVE